MVAKERHEQVIVKALGYEKEAKVREAAAWALGDVHDPRAVEPRVGALKETQSLVRSSVAEALGQIVEPLIGALGDQDWNVRRAAAQALGGLGWRPGRTGIAPARLSTVQRQPTHTYFEARIGPP
jgi:HEAT repeat protein